MAQRYRSRHEDRGVPAPDRRSKGGRPYRDDDAGRDDQPATLRSLGRNLPSIPSHSAISELVGRGRVAMALLMGFLAFIAYTVSSNAPVAQTPTPAVELGPAHQAALGRRSVQQMEDRYGGLSSDANLQNGVQQIGARLAGQSAASQAPFQFAFRVLADQETTNAFAIPGGHIYVTEALLAKLQSNAEVAAILAHQMAHLVQQHGFDRLAKATLSDGQTGAVVMASFLDESLPTDITSPQVAQLISETVDLHYIQDEEQRSDIQAIQFLAQAGFDPNGLIRALQQLQTTESGMQTAFTETHPNPTRRLSDIRSEIQRIFPQGVPDNFVP